MKIPLLETSGGAFLECQAEDCDPRAKGSVIICPGGGYSWLSPREGEPVAVAFRRHGWRAFVLSYSISNPPLGDAPLRELAQAVRLVRHGDGTNLPPSQQVVVCGFSAGGHLAASLGTHWDDESLHADSAVRRSSRPDAMILCYPVISSGEVGHRPSIERLLGEDTDTSRYFSLETQVTTGTPPAFIWHTAADAEVPVANSLLFAGALATTGIPVELHFFPDGPHGLSLATPEVAEPEKGRLPDAHVAEWFGACLRWLEYTLS